MKAVFATFVVLLGTIAVTAPAAGFEEELEEFELPTADPRYEHNRTLPFDSPIEFLTGAFPAEPQWVDPQVEQRRILGLESNRKFVSDLVRTPGAAEQISTYGVVLSESEEKLLLTGRDLEDAAIEIAESLGNVPGFGGVRVHWSGKPLYSSGWVEVFATVDAISATETALEKIQTAEQVEVTTVSHSIAELAGFVDAYYGNDSASRRTLSSETAEAAAQLRLRTADDPNVQALGYSLVRNRLEISVADPVRSPELVDGRIGGIEFAVVVDHSVGDSDGVNPCTTAGCGPQHAGVAIERAQGTTPCTLGFAVKSGSNENWTTAGHCPGTGADAQFFRGSTASGDVWSYGFFFGRETDVRIGSYAASGYYSGSRIDGQTIAETDHLVTNRVVTGINSAARVTSSVSYWAVTGINVCRVGGESLFAHCAPVIDIGRSFTGPGGVSLTSQIEAPASISGVDGDSGGPVFRQSNNSSAVGLYIGKWTIDGRTAVSSTTFLSDIASGLYLYTTTDKRRDFVLQMYENGLGRFADVGGYNYWRGLLNTCSTGNARTIAREILKSSEFRDAYQIGTLDGRRIRVELAYWTVLGRGSDSGGLDYWAGVATSESGWTTVVNAMTTSSEFGQRVWNGASAYDGDVC